MNPLFIYFLRSIMCYVFNVHTTFCRIHHYILLLCTVEENRKVEFFTLAWSVIVHILCNEDLVYFFTSFTRLDGYQGITKDVGCNGLHFFSALYHFYTVLLRYFFHRTLTAATCMDLGLYNRKFCTFIGSYFFVRFYSIFYRFSSNAFLGRNMVSFNYFLAWYS